MSRMPETRPSLLVRLRDAQDEQAWAEFLAIYEPLVYRVARKRGFQDADACELTQEVLLAISRSIDRWDTDRNRGSFRGWLFRVARNLMINHLSHCRRQPQPIGGTDMAKLFEQQPDGSTEESVLFDLEYKRHVFRWAAAAIRGEFHDGTWHAFWRTCVEGDTIPEVAGELGLSAGSVYVARSRVMARLRQKVEQFERE